MKKFFVLVLAFVCALTAFSACGDKEDSGTDSSVSIERKTVTELKDVVAAEMVSASFAMTDDMVYDDSGIDPATFKEGFWLCDADMLSAEVVAVYMANSESDAENIRTLLSNKLASLTSQYKNYNADNYAMAQKAVVGGNGLYAYMIISPNVSELNKLVKGALGL